MSHIARVGRNSWKVRAGIAALYGVLIVGSVTTVYPFLLMVSTAMKSHVDYAEYSPQALVPRYLYDDASLFSKYVEDKYANNVDDINAAYNTDYAKPADVKPPAAVDNALVDKWNAFVKTLPPTETRAGFGEHDNAPSRLLLRYRDYLRRKFHNDIAALNTAWTEENVSFDGVVPPFERTALREWMPDNTNPKVRDWYEFRKTLPDNYAVVTLVDPLYRQFLRQDLYEDSLAKLNAVWHDSQCAEVKAWSDITLPRRLVDITGKGQAADAEKFLRTKFPLRMLSLDHSVWEIYSVGDRKVSSGFLPAWRNFLAKRGRKVAATADPADPVFQILIATEDRKDYADFVAADCPASSLIADSPDNLWRQSAGNVAPPVAAADWQYVLAHKGELRSEFASRNFRAVLGYILLNGRSVWNTILFCGFSILAALIVNPMCAYALSRYPLPYAYKVLLFVLATMAFPAEVAMIPNFLLLKQLGMLNSFWALVLPGLANGFSIFLLKGFFDSLPKELYEAGILDGATELTMFRRITIPLSLPIFSVIALNAFTAAYGAFLFAMVVCQDPKMWTLMVWLYNLQDTAPQYVIMAALTLAAIPTLVVFLFAQKVILRGIILPSFK